ncbi:unnamed protein product [Oikopleura dioica]|uniref:Sodium/phosphate cotransporter 2B n=1 Tax=Oikopleura dioica TaxID=34765 RepID=E4X5H0_OIKDI|nr:unnamed protein product [Oikopleura dioica]
MIVRNLKSVLSGHINRIIREYIDRDLPGVFKPLTDYLYVIVGMLMTVAVQSSSIVCAVITPLCGIGVISLERAYSLIVGCCIGTTTTGLIAALASMGDGFAESMQVSLAHLFFNMVGFLLWFVVPCARRLPIRLALWAGAETEKYRWWAFCYIIGLFLAFPGLAFILSLVAPIFSDKVIKESYSFQNGLTFAKLYKLCSGNSIESDYTPKYKIQSAQAAPKVFLKQAVDSVDIDVDVDEFGRGKKKKNKNKNKNKLPKPKKITTTTAAPTTTGWDKFTSVSANYDDYYFYPEKDWKIVETTTTDRYEPTTTSWPTTPALVYTTEAPQQLKPVKQYNLPAGLQLPAHLSNFNAGVFAAPKPDFAISPEDEYEYYYEYYYDESDSYDDLGMKKPTKKKRRKKRKKNQKKKKNQKNYANYQNSYSQPAFECWECLSANSFEDCQNRGKYVQCNGGSIGCDITVRSRRNNRYRDWYIEKVQMGCKQMQSCQTEHQFNFGYHPQCFPEDSTWPALLQWNHSTCRQCCGTSKCNFDWFQNKPDTTAEWNSTDSHVVSGYGNYNSNSGSYNYNYNNNYNSQNNNNYANNGAYNGGYYNG